MRVFAVSDIHVDYPENERWLFGLSHIDYKDDILIVAGDLTDNRELLARCFSCLSERFRTVLFVPGNHELWIRRDSINTSLEKYQKICELAANCGISMEAYHSGTLSVIPLLGWYDYSFGEPGAKLMNEWMDFRTCVWPENWEMSDVANFFLNKNSTSPQPNTPTRISFSHFLPRIDLMPAFIPSTLRYLYPVLGSAMIEDQIRKLKPQIHIYGHSHVNRQAYIGEIQYINNAFGYPSERGIAKKELMCIYED